jgi:hypothetical protein
MSYTPPALGSIDLAGDGSAYTPPSLGSIDLSGGATTPSDPTGSISASLNLTASLSGFMQPVGELLAALPFTANFLGGDSVWGALAAEIVFGAELYGQAADTFGSVNSALDFSFSGRGFQDWTSSLPSSILQTFYTLTITGSPDLVVPISSWQATLQTGERSDYLQATIPAAGNLSEAISERQDGRLIIRKGYRFDDGSERSEIIVESEFSTIRSDRGPINYTITVSGYLQSKPAQSATRKLSNVRSLNMSNGNYRARSDVDLFLQPGMTVEAVGIYFTANYINFYANGVDQFCEVGGN